MFITANYILEQFFDKKLPYSRKGDGLVLVWLKEKPFQIEVVSGSSSSFDDLTKGGFFLPKSYLRCKYGNFWPENMLAV